MTVGYQGEEGAYSEEALYRLFPEATPQPFPAFEDVFDALQDGAIRRAVIPIENSLFGSVHINYDLLRDHAVHIVGEGNLAIRHHLMATPGASLEEIRHVHSHPQALGQCRVFLRERLNAARPVPAHDTAGAARLVAERGDTGHAAIASKRAAETYGLQILASGVESNMHNQTRFLVLAQGHFEEAMDAEPGRAKTSLVYALRENVPGALFKTLAVFALREIDLLKVESRPLIGEPGRYLFYVDVAGSVSAPPLSRSVEHLQELTSELRILGSYPAGERL